nr:hypothetical protein [uncultured Rhodopila sp.]
MPLIIPSPRLPVITFGLALALSGCAAVPLAEMAASRMAPPANDTPACADGPDCATKVAGNGLPDLSKSLGDTFHALTVPASAPHQVAADGATK